MTGRRKDAASVASDIGRQRPVADAVPGTGAASEPDSADRARLLRTAAMHGQAAVRVGELIAGNAAQREDLLRRLAVLRVLGGTPAGAGAAELEREVVTLGRIIAWQARTAAWHRSEAGRLRDLAAQPGQP